ncbi:MAG: hypothetical protein IPQ07_35195 [Myxococcales bacterium]|nr:hypothetical protein [Myxococcales bacterium]
MAYRNDVDALEARLVAIQGELDDATRQRDIAAHLLEEARARAAAEGLAADWAAGGPQRRRRRRARILIATVGFALVGGLVTYRVTRDRGAGDQREVLERFATFTDQMCTCHDKACADQVMGSMTTWSMKMAREQSQAPMELDAATRERMSKLVEHFGECMVTAMGPPEPAPGVVNVDEAVSTGPSPNPRGQ